ncbi:MAG: 4'-phosphopantetheinyl transferase superfamily protein [Terriglobales bacterium]
MIFKPVDPEPLRHLDGILPDDEVHVWHVDLVAWDQEADWLLELLSAEEQERAARFKFPGPRNQYLISRALLRRALGRYLKIEGHEVRFRTATNGKPELAAASDLRFNLSHTQGATVFAITRKRHVGVDVERMRKDTNAMELAERFFSRPEVRWLRSQPGSEVIASFFSCWTAKEAYIKAQGEGLSMPLSSFGVVPSPAGAGSKLQLEVYDDPEESKRWFMWRLDIGPDLRAALAVDGESCRVRVGKWPQPDTHDRE